MKGQVTRINETEKLCYAKIYLSGPPWCTVMNPQAMTDSHSVSTRIQTIYIYIYECINVCMNVPYVSMHRHLSACLCDGMHSRLSACTIKPPRHNKPGEPEKELFMVLLLVSQC